MRGLESKKTHANSHRCKRNHEFIPELTLGFNNILTFQTLCVDIWGSIWGSYHIMCDGSIKNYAFKVIKQYIAYVWKGKNYVISVLTIFGKF